MSNVCAAYIQATNMEAGRVKPNKAILTIKPTPKGRAKEINPKVNVLYLCRFTSVRFIVREARNMM